jgi:DNA-binding PadR family transcriptional regulator
MTTVRSSVNVAAVLNVFLDDLDEAQYGLRLLRALNMGSGTLYPILGRLVKAGWLSEEREEVNREHPGRPPRRWYRLTGEGRRAAPAFTGRIRNLRPATTPRYDPTVQLGQWERWMAPGSTIVELEYHGHGIYSAEETTVTRVTPQQVFTATGNVFWRSRCGRRRVGETSRRNANIPTRYIRIVPRDNKHAVAELGPSPAAQPEQVAS